MGSSVDRRDSRTLTVLVGDVQIGGGAPVVVQSMTNTDTSDPQSTAEQCEALVAAGSELVRITVNTAEAAAAVPEIRRRLDDAGCRAPLIGDFHYNGHLLLRQHPGCANSLAKYRINPGNVGRRSRGDDNFAEICAIARDHGTAVRIGVNGGSLDPELVRSKMEENASLTAARTSDEVVDECMVISALQSSEAAFEHGLDPSRIVISCKVASPPRLIGIYRKLSARTRQPLHLGLTEAGMGTKGLVWSASAMAVLLAEGIGDTIRVSLTPRPGGDRTEEVVAACELLQALGLRAFAPSVTACPGCGRTTSTVFQILAERVEQHVRARIPEWRERHPGVENLTLAVMGCIVNGPGESKNADIGISLPGTGEEPRCPVFVDGERITTLQGSPDEIAGVFLTIIEDYVRRKYPEVGQ
jgi:(E)-4-hydroxy-3-methylbut-2-enyl-diphosphate synthase